MDRTAEPNLSAARPLPPPLGRRLAVAPIRAYQACLSPLLPPSCRFEPSCSEYARQAILKRGLRVGIRLAFARLLRCHPFHSGGVDPVPEK